MRRLSFNIDKQCDGVDVKRYCRKYLGLSSRAFIKQKYALDGMMINGRRCRSVDILCEGDVFEINIPDDMAEYKAMEYPLDVIYEDEDILAVNKPPGMAVHPSGGYKSICLLNAVAYYREKRHENYSFRPVYRLDRDTSGIVMLAKSRISVSSSKLDKRYYAVCEGFMGESGEIDVPIGRDSQSGILREAGHGRHAVTRWKRLSYDGSHSLIEAELLTGRTHQIRVHMAHMGHPLAGDDLYGGNLDKIGRQALHCGKLYIENRVLGKEISLVSGFPEDMKGVFPELFKEDFLCPDR